MKRSVVLILLLFLTSFASAETLNFEFGGPGGPYRSTELIDLLQLRLGFVFDKMTAILIETPSLKDPGYMEQVKVLDELDDTMLDGIHLMYITASVSKMPEDGYMTTVEEAKAIAGGNRVLRIRFLDGNGNVYHTSNKPLTSDDIIRIVRSGQSAGN
ncbi:MAG: hypothetical protein JSV21_02470 [Nitrospirota bacterium]|nr:MAG: hypothetical protein JSV21_02470 [Nitrospirota bacterium]